MIRTRRCLLVAVMFIALAPMGGVVARVQDGAAARPIEVADVPGWNTVASPVLSGSGEWFAYRDAPSEGDGEVVARNTRTAKEWRFSIGEVPLPSAGAPGAAPAGPPPASIAVSDDSRWLAFTTYPSHGDAARLKRQHRPLQNGVTLVNLTNGDKQEYPKVRRFGFSSGTAPWIALYRYAAGPAPVPALGSGGDAAAPGGARDRPRGADLILRDLASGREENVGNVADFSFTHDGRRLALTLDAPDKVGNGVQVRDLTSGTVTVLDSGAASYERPAWNDAGDALAVLKGTEDTAYRDARYAVLGFSGIGAGAAKVTTTTYDPKADRTFPAGMTISPSRDPRWTDDRQALLFGIHELRRKDPADARASEAASGAETGSPSQAAPDAGAEKVDLVLWHWKDPRLQTQQEVQEGRDRAFSFLAEYRVGTHAFIRLADDDVRTVNVAPKDRWAVGLDERAYELMENLDGRRFQDIYAIDLETGRRTPAVKHVRWYNGPSPDGRSLLYYDDGNYDVYSFETGTTRAITAGAPVSFVDVEDDHNVVKPPAPVIGWASDSRSVLLSDRWDVWRIPVDAGPAVNLTVNGRRDAVRYQRRFATERPGDRDKGIDLTVPQYFSAYGEWTKKGGIARLKPGTPGVELVEWADASYATLLKAKDADRFVFSRETETDPSDYYAADAAFGEGQRLSDQRAALKAFAWSSGSMIVNYTSDKGDKLQAALYLPANYEKGKAYPMVVQIYERESQGANTFDTPRANGFDRSLYTSHGYAVLHPDITYRVNDPGMSAVWCVVPAVKAAIATGVVDPKHVGLTGHSWGGYQTAFLVTQTDMFTAAVAGAPLTDMVSMYSLIYKNTGGGNGAIFEASQGRFKGGYWDNWDAYYRNSPVFFAKNVHTPLMLLHNDKDGAVDFTQGVEYFNTLRRMQKPVILLEYLGENHGLRKPANQRDYTVRMFEYFDHYLKGAPAPDWMVNGVARLQMEDHLKSRAHAASSPQTSRR